MLTRVLVLLITIFTAISLQAQTDSTEIIKKDLRTYIEEQLKSSKAASFGVAVVDGQETIWAEGFGFADIENEKKATEKTIYRVGSVSKLFTAVSIMQLTEKKKIDLNEEVQQYIQEFAIKKRYPGKITVKSLLTHHSGLPSDIMKDFFVDSMPDYTNIVKYLNEEYTCAPPEFIRSYSNAAYSLLGVIVERMSKQDFFTYTDENIFKPLKMEHTYFGLKDNMKLLYAKGYKKKSEVYDEPYLRDIPAGFLHTNALDMANFMKMIFNGGRYNEKQILKTKTLKQMLTVQNDDVDLDLNSRMGLCWFLSGEESMWDTVGGMAEHGGDTYVYHASFQILPHQGLGVIVMTNSASGAKATRDISEKLLTEFLRIRKGIAIEKPEKPDIKLEKKKKMNFEKYVGDYVLGTSYNPIYKSGRFLTTKQGGLSLNFVPNNQNSFTPRIRILRIFGIPIKSQQLTFKEIDGKNYVVYINNKDSTIFGTEITPQVISPVWYKREGHYVSTNDQSEMRMIGDIDLKIKDDVIIVSTKNGFAGASMAFTALPVNDNQLLVQGVGRQTGYTINFVDDTFSFSGIMFKKEK